MFYAIYVATRYTWQLALVLVPVYFKTLCLLLYLFYQEFKYNITAVCASPAVIVSGLERLVLGQIYLSAIIPMFSDLNHISSSSVLITAIIEVCVISTKYP